VATLPDDEAKMWLIIGAGFTGSRLARDVANHSERVVVTRRTLADANEVVTFCGAAGNVEAMVLDLDDEQQLSTVRVASGTIVVHCAPPGKGNHEATLIRALTGAAQLIYVSSTGVYGPAHGANHGATERTLGGGVWFDENIPTAPQSASGIARAAAEQRIVEACAAQSLPLAILRSSGIYGYDRGVIHRLRTGVMRVIGDGSSVVCRIHVDDLVASIRAAADHKAVGIFNISDDDPTSLGIVADHTADALGLPRPPRVAAGNVPPEVAAMLLANRRIDNRRMHEVLGVTLRYPSWRTALAEELASASPLET
jgi:nucleoside-diphosphate-sugar epimerase